MNGNGFLRCPSLVLNQCCSNFLDARKHDYLTNRREAGSNMFEGQRRASAKLSKSRDLIVGRAKCSKLDSLGLLFTFI